MFNFVKKTKRHLETCSERRNIPAGQFLCLGGDESPDPEGQIIDHWVKAPNEPGRYTFYYIIDEENHISGWRWVKDEEPVTAPFLFSDKPNAGDNVPEYYAIHEKITDGIMLLQIIF